MPEQRRNDPQRGLYDRRQVLRFGGGLLAAGPLASALAACGGDDDGDTASSSGADDSGQLDRPLSLHHDAALGPAFAPYVKYFNRTYAPLKLSTSYVTQDYVGTTQTQLAGGNVDYDVLFVDEGYAQRWYDAGWIQALDEISVLEPALADLQSGVEDALRTSEGDLLAMPYYRRVELFIYNKDHLGQIDASPPETWEEFVEQCRELKSKGIVDTPYSPFWNQEFSIIWYGLAAEAISDGAGDFFGEDYAPQFQDDEAVLGTIERWRTLYEEGLAPRDSFTTSYANTANVFAGGKSSFTIRYGLQLKGFRDSKQSKVADAAANALMPGSERASLAGGAYWVMTESTPAPQTAGKLMSYLSYKDEGGDLYVPTNLIAKDLGLQTPYEAVNASPVARNAWAEWSDPEVLEEQLGNSVDLGPVVHQRWYGQFIETATGLVQDAVRGQKDPKEALDEAAEFVRTEAA